MARRASDPVNNVSPEMSAAGRRWAEKYEEIYSKGHRLWGQIKNKFEKEGKDPPKFYFVGPAGNNGHEVIESFLDVLAYTPATDGTLYLHRKPTGDYPDMVYDMLFADKELSRRSKIAATDLYVEDEKAFRDLETEILKEFSEAKYEGHPQGMLVGESAVLQEENVEIMKKTGIVIWLAASSDFTWQKTQCQPRQTGGLYQPPDLQQRPPVWALANGWDGDVDDSEAKQDYAEIAKNLEKKYEEVSELRIGVDVDTIVGNSAFGAKALTRVMTDYYGLSEEGEASVEEEVIEKDLERFLEGARLSKYLKQAVEWCEEQGAASIEDVVENVPEFSEAMSLKPLERKRLEKAAAAANV
jgi:shikimate kinase